MWDVFLISGTQNIPQVDKYCINVSKMDKLLALHQKIVPEIIPILLTRYQILRSIRYLQPIGRRALAEQLQLQERKIRNEVDFLREQQLIQSNVSGMSVTVEGEQLLWDLEGYIREIQGLKDLEEQISQLYSIKRVIVVPGNVDEDPNVKKDLSRVTADYLNKHLRDDSILAVTGGTTLAEVASMLTPPAVKRDITVIPARGGLGEEVEIQANTVAANIAKGLGASYRLLHVPDDLQAETMQSILNEPKIKEVLELLKKADIILHGIGSAEEMARRRGMSPEDIKNLVGKGAVGEAFGYYFDQEGNLIHITSSVGLQLSDLHLAQVMTVVGGRSKGLAVKAVLLNSSRDILIIDEGAARVILKG